MTNKNDVEVIINGKVYTLSGYESPDYIQRIASFINNKLVEIKSEDSYKKLDIDMRNLLLNLNMADEYFRAKKKAEDFEKDSKEKDKELYDLKHELIMIKNQLESANNDNDKLKNDINDFQKTIVRLETELTERKSSNHK